MTNLPQDPNQNSDVARRVRAIAEEVYGRSESYLSDSSTAPNRDDLCPLYNSILHITDRYQSPELVGRGGMKEVYRVFDEKMARHVAMAKPLEAHTEDHFDSFLREAHLTAKLEHPCIIEVFDMGVDDQQRPYFTMEFKRGRTLRALIRDIRENESHDQTSVQKRLGIFIRVCEAIAYAHSRRVLHLDIKPSNIQIGEFGEVKVCDWGLGVVMPDDEATEDSAALLDPDLYGPLMKNTQGTPAYMAPEQSDQLQPKSPQMDIYALGCVLHELMTGQKYKKGPHEKNVTSGLSAVIKKAVAENPANRYASVDEMRADIARSMSFYSTSVEKPNLFREATLFWKRHREACIVVLGACVLLGTFLSYFVYQLTIKEQLAVAAKQNAELSEQTAVVARDQAEAAELEAKELLAKYQAKDAESAQLTSELQVSDTRFESLQHQAHQAFAVQPSSISVEDSIRYYSRLIDQGVAPDSRATDLLCWWHFVAQDFEAVCELMGKSDSEDPRLHELAKIFAPRLNSDGYLEKEDVVDLFKHLRKRPLLGDRILRYDTNHPRTIQDRVRIIGNWVAVMNSALGKTDLSFDEENRQVRLRGPVKRLIHRVGINKAVVINFLQLLDPLILDLRGSAIKNLHQCTGLGLVEVDIRGTPIKDLSPLSNFRSIQRIHLEEGRFDESQLALVPVWMDVISHPQDETND